MKQKKVHPYYNFDKIFSFNAFFMFVIGGRGLGKTYGAKKKAIANYIRKGEQFIYLRRFKSELSARTTFFDDLIANNEFPEWDFRVDGDKAQISGAEFRDDKKREWQTIGYFAALSTAQTQKSKAFPLVTVIIFDEFIIEKGATHYLPDEAIALQQFYSTIDRWQDKTRVLFLANSVSIMNPYFITWKIRPDADTEWIKAAIQADGTPYMAVHIAKSSDFAASVQATRFGQFIANTDYADFAIGNGFKDNNTALLAPKDPRARYKYTLQTPSGTFSVWYNGISNEFYALESRPKTERIFVTSPHMMREDTKLLLRNDKLLQYLRTAFRNGSIQFDNPTTRNAMIEVFK